jgi:hypothetical protein
MLHNSVFFTENFALSWKDTLNILNKSRTIATSNFGIEILGLSSFERKITRVQLHKRSRKRKSLSIRCSSSGNTIFDIKMNLLQPQNLNRVIS